jgi:hypothetical protein
MRKKKILLLSIIITLGFIAFIPLIHVQAAEYTCPDTSAGDTKILKVTTVDATGLEAMFGSDWKQTLNSSFGGSAATLGARSKSVVLSINKTGILDFGGLGTYNVCNITVDNWVFTTGEFASTPDNASLDVYVIKDPTRLNTFCSLFYGGLNVTVARMAAYLAQLPQNPSGYLAEINWSLINGFGSQGSNIIHNIENAPFVNALGIRYEVNGSETWTYADSNGAWIAYELKDENGKTIYKFEIELPGIPGFEIPIFFGVTAVSILGIITIMKRKKRV